MSSPIIRHAVLLAAGRGTRLGALTADRPKPLLSIGRRPIIAHILDGLMTAGIEQVTVITGYHASMIEAELGNGAGSGVSISYVRQEQVDGTARALALAHEAVGDERFIFSWGDILVHPQNYAGVLRAARLADASLAVNFVGDPSNGAAVYTEPALPDPPHGGAPAAFVTRIVEKPAPGTSTTRWNNAGFGVLGLQVWDAIEQIAPSSRGEFELPTAIDAMIRAGARVRAVPVEGPWFDIGTPTDLEAARAAFAT